MSQESETHSYLLEGFSPVGVYHPLCVPFSAWGRPESSHTALSYCEQHTFV